MYFGFINFSFFLRYYIFQLCRFPLCWAGGALALLLIEAVRRQALDRDTEGVINYAGYVFLILTGIYLFTRDLDRLGGTLFGGGMPGQ